MSNFRVSVDHYMSSPVHSVSGGETLETARNRLEELRISSLAVTDGSGQIIGVISMTDLIRVGRLQAGSLPRSSLLTLPNQSIEKVMSRDVVTVQPADPMALAAQRMVDGYFHRVYVQERNRLVGVLTTRDVMLAIRDKRVRQPIADWMSSPAFSVRAEEPISIATERLEKAHVSGLVVLENDWPVGLYTQREALRSRNQSRDTQVEVVMSGAMLVLSQKTPLYRAAAQVAELLVRRVIAIDDNRKISGILTGIDFARVAASGG